MEASGFGARHQNLHERLRGAGVLPTLQRLAIGEVLLARPVRTTAGGAVSKLLRHGLMSSPPRRV